MPTDTADSLCAAATAIARQRCSTQAEWADAFARMRDLQERFERLREQDGVLFADRIRLRDIRREFDHARKAVIVPGGTPTGDRGPMTPEALARRRAIIDRMKQARTIEEAQGIDGEWKTSAGRVDGALLGEWLAVKAAMVQRVTAAPRRRWWFRR